MKKTNIKINETNVIIFYTSIIKKNLENRYWIRERPRCVCVCVWQGGLVSLGDGYQVKFKTSGEAVIIRDGGGGKLNNIHEDCSDRRELEVQKKKKNGQILNESKR